MATTFRGIQAEVFTIPTNVTFRGIQAETTPVPKSIFRGIQAEVFKPTGFVQIIKKKN